MELFLIKASLHILSIGLLLKTPQSMLQEKELSVKLNQIATKEEVIHLLKTKPTWFL